MLYIITLIAIGISWWLVEARDEDKKMIHLLNLDFNWIDKKWKECYAEKERAERFSRHNEKNYLSQSKKIKELEKELAEDIDFITAIHNLKIGEKHTLFFQETEKIPGHSIIIKRISPEKHGCYKIKRKNAMKIPTVKDLMEEMIENGIHSCEVRFKGCTHALYLAPAHRRKRLWYKKRSELLWTFNEVIMACQNCHETLEASRELTEKTFEKLRPN